MMMTGKDRQSTAAHCSASRGSTENSRAAQGTYRMKQCRSMDTTMAPSSHLLAHGGSLDDSRAGGVQITDPQSPRHPDCQCCLEG